MAFTPAIQEALLAVYSFNDDYCNIIKTIVKPEQFDLYYKDIAEQVDLFSEKYKKSPKEHLLDLINLLKERFPDREDIYEQIYYSILEIKDGINIEYTINEASKFSREQSLRKAVTSALEILESNNIDEAENVLYKSLNTTTDLFNSGLRVNDFEQAIQFLNREPSEFKTGILDLDLVDANPARKALHIFMALPGKGKSWYLLNLAKHALIHRKKVLYVTLEMSEEEISKRFIQSFFSITKRKANYEIPRLEKDELGRFIDLDFETLSNRPSFEDDDIKQILKEKWHRLENRTPFIVKEFPTSQLTVPMLSTYLDSLELYEKFIPDLICVDYPDLMKINKNKQREEISGIYKELRGIGVERNVAMACVSQSNKAGMNSDIIDERNLDETFSKAGIADSVVTFNQTQDEYELGLARLFVAKTRTDVGKFKILISQAYSIGQFCMDSCKFTSDYNKKIKQYKKHDEDDDE